MSEVCVYSDIYFAGEQYARLDTTPSNSVPGVSTATVTSPMVAALSGPLAIPLAFVTTTSVLSAHSLKIVEQASFAVDTSVSLVSLRYPFTFSGAPRY